MRSIYAYQDPFDYELWVVPHANMVRPFRPIFPIMAHWGKLVDMAPYLWGLRLVGAEAMNNRSHVFCMAEFFVLYKMWDIHDPTYWYCAQFIDCEGPRRMAQ